MKTALEWAEYLPLQIKLWFIEECERQEAHFTCEYPSLVDAICGELFDWSYTEFGYEFWDFVWHIALDYQGREAEILSDYIDETIPYTKSEVDAMILEYADPNDEVCKVMLANVGKARVVAPSANAKRIMLDELGQTEARVLDAPKWGELVEAPKEKKSSIYSKVIKTLKAENEALLQSNTEFKKRHKKLLKANQESMERRVELGTANSNLLSEIEKLKIWVEAEKDEIQKLYTVIYEQSDEKKALKADIFYLEETIKIQEETIKTLTQMAVAPKKEQSIFFDLLEHIGLRK